MTELGVWQTELPVANRSATGVEAIEIAIQHHQLPKLAAMSVVKYDPARGDDYAQDPPPTRRPGISTPSEGRNAG